MSRGPLIRRIRLGPVLVLALLLGCSTSPRPVPDDRAAAWAELRSQLQALDAWRAEGRLAVRGVAEPGQANFTWSQSPTGGFRLELDGPWGQSAGRLVVDASGRSVLTTRRGREYVGRDPARLVQRLYGWQIPVRALRQWLLGLPGEAPYELDRFGRLAAVDWQAWQIDYRRHRVVEGLDLPVNLRARDTRAGTELRVAVDRWHIGRDGQTPPGDSPVPLIGGEQGPGK